MKNTGLDWVDIADDPRFNALRDKKNNFMWWMFLFTATFYILLPTFSAYWPTFFQIKVGNVLSLGLVFAFLQICTAIIVSILYLSYVNRKLDDLAMEFRVKIKKVSKESDGE